ncbi:MAG: PaaI family thioesterase [Desulfovibrionaceae bacterium]
MPRHYLRHVQEPGQTVNPLFNTLGVRVEHIGADRAVLCMDVDERHIQGAGVAAGGILATLLDEAMAHAVIATLDNGDATATVDMSVRFLRPVKRGDAVRAEARVLRRGGRIIHVEADVLLPNGDIAARGAASFIVNGR